MTNSIEHYVKSWSVLYREGRIGEAVALLREAVEVYPDEGYLYSQLSSALWDAGLRDEAIEACYASTRLDADLECPRLILSHHLRKVGRRDEALTILREGLAACPRSRVLWLRELAYVYVEIGDLAQAVSQLVVRFVNA